MIKIIIVIAMFFLNINFVVAEEFPIDLVPKKYIIKELSKPIRMPNIKFIDDEKKIHNIEEFEGNFVILHLWATWNVFCANKIIGLAELQKEYKKEKLKIIALSQDYKGYDVVKKFYEEKKISNLKIYLDQKNSTLKSLSVLSLPTTILIDKDGFEVARIVGVIDWMHNKQLKDLLQKYLDKTSN